MAELSRLQKVALEVLKPHELAIKHLQGKISHDIGNELLEMEGGKRPSHIVVFNTHHISVETTNKADAQEAARALAALANPPGESTKWVIWTHKDNDRFTAIAYEHLPKDDPSVAEGILTFMADNGINYPGAANHKTKQRAS